MKQDIDILVNGGGVGGLTVAYSLAKQGLSVAIIEKNDMHTMVNGADLLKPSGIKILSELGLLDEIIKAGGLQRDKLKVFFNGEMLSFLDYSLFDELGYFILVPYSVVRDILWQNLQVLDNVKIHFNTQIKALVSAKSKVDEVRLSNNLCYMPSVIIGADGSGSYLRKWMSIEAKRDIYPQRMFLSTFPIVSSVQDINHLYLDDKQGLAYFYPITKQQLRLVIGFPQEEARQLMQDTSGDRLRCRLAEFVTESEDALVQINSTTPFKGIPIARMHITKYYNDNIALLGDAIHNIHPITGQGMNLAIEDAQELSDCLSCFFNKELDLEESLEQYFNNRFHINSAVVQYGHSLATNFGSREQFFNNFNSKIQGSGRRNIINQM